MYDKNVQGGTLKVLPGPKSTHFVGSISFAEDILHSSRPPGPWTTKDDATWDYQFNIGPRVGGSR